MNSRDEIAPAPPRAHSGDDLDSLLIARLALIFVLGLATAIVVAAVLFRLLEHAHPRRTSEAAPRVFPADLPPPPRLQPAPALDLEAVRLQEDRHLSRYAWIDRGQGIAQIPIDRAMVLWLRTNGGPAATNAAPAATTELQMRQDKAKEADHAP